MKRALLFFMMIVAGFCHCVGASRLMEESVAMDKKERCKLVIDRYYSDYSLLLGNKINGDEIPDFIEKIQKKYFRDSVRIESDDANLHKKKYDFNDYHNGIAEFYGEINGTVHTNISDIGPIFYNANDNSYFIVATVEKQIIVDKDDAGATDGERRLVDVYINFTSEDNNPKIYNITNHSAIKRINADSVEIIDNELHYSKKNAFFIFNIKPVDASVVLDGQEIAYANGQQHEVFQGSHRIEIKAEGYESKLFSAEASKKVIGTVTEELVLKHGYLNVYADNDDDNGATVFVNNVEVGTIPMQQFPLAVGDYKIKVKKEKRHKVCRVSIDANRNTNLNVELRTNRYLRREVVNTYVYFYVAPVLVPSYYFCNPDSRMLRGQPGAATFNVRPYITSFHNGRTVIPVQPVRQSYGPPQMDRRTARRQNRERAHQERENRQRESQEREIRQRAYQEREIRQREHREPARSNDGGRSQQGGVRRFFGGGRQSQGNRSPNFFRNGNNGSPRRNGQSNPRSIFRQAMPSGENGSGNRPLNLFRNGNNGSPARNVQPNQKSIFRQVMPSGGNGSGNKPREGNSGRR